MAETRKEHNISFLLFVDGPLTVCTEHLRAKKMLLTVTVISKDIEIKLGELKFAYQYI